MPSTLKGKLMFTHDGYHHDLEKPYQPRSWPLIQEDGSEIDIRPLVMAVFQCLDGKRVREENGVDFHNFTIDDDSPDTLKYNEGHPMLQRKMAYLTPDTISRKLLVGWRLEKLLLRSMSQALELKLTPQKQCFMFKPLAILQIVPYQTRSREPSVVYTQTNVVFSVTNKMDGIYVINSAA